MGRGSGCPVIPWLFAQCLRPHVTCCGSILCHRTPMTIRVLSRCWLSNPKVNPVTTPQYQTHRQVRTQPIDSLPQHWNAMSANTSCHSCLIQPGSPEHNEILNLFRATCAKIVLKVPVVPKDRSIIVIHVK
ncbi:unnamed protein product [Oncorhynchus mykiss]|uniref:Uncharacterized protein n=1 Tax=Oncorhynchus mykiss TaxID=8022 RepID=A0A060X4P0_ONCMY|nr:unnamed protein product [Oncorhynchus mykiss]